MKGLLLAGGALLAGYLGYRYYQAKTASPDVAKVGDNLIVPLNRVHTSDNQSPQALATAAGFAFEKADQPVRVKVTAVNPDTYAVTLGKVVASVNRADVTAQNILKTV